MNRFTFGTLSLIYTGIIVPFCLPLIGATKTPEPVVVDAVRDRYVPLEFEQQKLTGLLARRMRANLEGRLLSVDEKGLVKGFQHRPGEQEWIGEHLGKFLDAAANTYEYTHDQRLRELMVRIAKEFMATQEPDGYLGTYTDKNRWTAWDVWVHKYDLLGLLAYYRVTGDEHALASAVKVGNLLVNTFGDTPGKRDIIASGTHVGMAATSVLEPMVYLYRYTGDERYLEFCKYLLRAWNQPNGPKIIATLDSVGSVYKTANAKAYEMLSNLVGLTELYRTTGDESYLRPVLRAWDDVHTKRLYITGTASSKEHFTPDGHLPADQEDNIGEGCVTVTWMQLSLNLLRLTGQPKYAEQLERSIYNHLLAAQDSSNGDICYYTALNGTKEATKGISCCVSSEPRGISLIPLAIWGRLDRGIAVNLYTGGRANFKIGKRGSVNIYQETTYPQTGEILLHIEPEHNVRFPLRLRVPEWTDHYSASIQESNEVGKPGTYLILNREWKRGDTVKISMDMTVQVISGSPTYPDQVAIQRGPQVLALEQTINPDLSELTKAGPASTNVAKLELTPADDKLPGTWAGEEAFTLAGVYNGQPRSLLLVPFADSRHYRVWMKKPDDAKLSSALYPTLPLHQ